MSVRISSVGVLQTVARALVAKQKYASKEEALKAIALAVVKNKIRAYQRRIRQLEHKYEMNFEKFTIRLQGNASPAEEDDWFALAVSTKYAC
jgi:hypothetical protein